MRTQFPIHRTILLAIATILAAPTALGAGTVAPGATLTFQDPDYGTRSCQVNAASASCFIPVFAGTGWNVSQHRVRARVIQPPPSSANPPSQASGSLHNEFILGGTPGHMVNARVSIDYRIHSAAVKVIGNAATEIAVMLGITDITNVSAPTAVAIRELYRLRRDNTQGVTDISAATERQVQLGESGGFDILLRTGRKYALSFTVEVIGDSFVGSNASVATAYWEGLSISVDEDEVELLNDIAIALEQHDKDIKLRLDHVDAKLERIERLLLTPQGRRPGWNGKN